MVALFISILLVALVVIISNQYSALKRMDSMQYSLDKLNKTLQDMNSQEK